MTKILNVTQARMGDGGGGDKTLASKFLLCDKNY